MSVKERSKGKSVAENNPKGEEGVEEKNNRTWTLKKKKKIEKRG